MQLLQRESRRRRQDIIVLIGFSACFSSGQSHVHAQRCRYIAEYVADAALFTEIIYEQEVKLSLA